MSSAKKLPKSGRTYRIWKVTEDLVKQNYREIRDMSMRDSYYFLREKLSQLVGNKINRDEYQYFNEKYNYYTQDLWARIEKNHGLKRPETKKITVLYDEGEETTLKGLHQVHDQARGFIFVEKAGKAEDLRKLSKYGWCILAGQGQSTRRMREILANSEDNRPILVFHDQDKYGDDIKRTLEGHSQRTEHLELWKDLETRIIDMGLNKKQVDALSLPREEDPTKSDADYRTEINALTALKARYDIENPFLLYAVSVMKEKDITISDEEQSAKIMVQIEIEEFLSDVLKDLINYEAIAREASKNINETCVEVAADYRWEDRKRNSFELPDEVKEDIGKELESLATELKEKIDYISESDKEQELINKIDKDTVSQIRRQLRGGK